MDSIKRIYSKSSIVLLSTIGSTFFGALLYAQNLKETDNKKYIVPTIIFSIVYSFLAYKLTLFLGIQTYYSYIPINLVGGLILIGLFWKHQIKVIDNFQKRNILWPSIFLIIPIALIIFLNIYNSPHKLNTREFQEANRIEFNKQMESAKFVSNDSTIQFFDICLPLLASSYTFSTQVEDVNTLYNYLDFEEGQFTVVCTRVLLAENDEFNLTLLGKGYSSLIEKDCNNRQFETMICADYIKKMSDTNIVYGTIAMIKVDRICYNFVTQYTELDKNSADSISNSLVDKIKASSTK